MRIKLSQTSRVRKSLGWAEAWVIDREQICMVELSDKHWEAGLKRETACRRGLTVSCKAEKSKVCYVGGPEYGS